MHGSASQGRKLTTTTTSRGKEEQCDFDPYFMKNSFEAMMASSASNKDPFCQGHRTIEEISPLIDKYVRELTTPEEPPVIIIIN